MAQVRQGMNAVKDSFYDGAFEAQLVQSIAAMQDAFPAKAQPTHQPSHMKP